MKNIAVILSSGTGHRFKDSLPKQYHLLNGKMVVEYVLDEIISSNSVDKTIVVVSSLEDKEKFPKKYNLEFVVGGNQRNISIGNALDYIKKNYPDTDKVIVFDSARPFIKGSIIKEFLDLLDEYEGVITAQKITDSLGTYDNDNLNRDDYYLIQAPEAFSFNHIYKYFSKDSPITSMVQQLPKGSKVYPYFGITNNMKITYPDDIVTASMILNKEENK